MQNVNQNSTGSINSELKLKLEEVVPLLHVLPVDSFESILKMDVVDRNIIYTYIFRRLRNLIESNDLNTDLCAFQFSSGQKAVIPKEQYEERLNQLSEFFIKVENYELAAECRDALILFNKNKLLM